MDVQTKNRDDLQMTAMGGNPSLLILDDDRPFLARLAKAMETRGYRVTTAASVDEGLIAISSFAPDYAIIDVRLGDGNGLDVEELADGRARIEIVAALFRIFQREQHLPRDEAGFAERFAPGSRERDLADGGGGLAFLQLQRAFRKFQHRAA